MDVYGKFQGNLPITFWDTVEIFGLRVVIMSGQDVTTCGRVHALFKIFIVSHTEVSDKSYLYI